MEEVSYKCEQSSLQCVQTSWKSQMEVTYCMHRAFWHQDASLCLQCWNVPPAGNFSLTAAVQLHPNQEKYDTGVRVSRCDCVFQSCVNAAALMLHRHVAGLLSSFTYCECKHVQAQVGSEAITQAATSHCAVHSVAPILKRYITLFKVHTARTASRMVTIRGSISEQNQK